MAAGSLTLQMHASMPLARQLSLLLIIAFTEYGYMHLDHSGAGAGSLGLTRLERDLSRRGIAAPCIDFRAKIC
jgi:hypothetical protein